MYEADPLAFEVCVRHVASLIEDQRRVQGKTPPGEMAALTFGRRRARIQRAHGDAQPSGRQRTAPRGATSRVATPRL